MKYLEYINKLGVKKRDSYDIKTPLPNEKHTYCSVCQESYENYLQHVNSSKHSKEVAKDPMYY